DGAGGGLALPVRGRLRRGGQHGEAFGGGGVMGGGRSLRADPWGFRLRGGFRHRAQIPRDPPLPGRPDLDQPDLVLPGRARAASAKVVLSGGHRPRHGTHIGREAFESVMSAVLLADIGGSKSRFALSGTSGGLTHPVVINNDAVAGFEA